jgi:hypothetical protein
MRVLGVDPGINGGLAIVAIDNGAAPQLVDAIDIPVAGVGPKERVDVLALRTWIAMHQPQHALVERAQAMPRQGSSSGFKYGKASCPRCANNIRNTWADTAPDSVPVSRTVSARRIRRRTAPGRRRQEFA